MSSARMSTIFGRNALVPAAKLPRLKPKTAPAVSHRSHRRKKCTFNFALMTLLEANRPRLLAQSSKPMKQSRRLAAVVERAFDPHHLNGRWRQPDGDVKVGTCSPCSCSARNLVCTATEKHMNHKLLLSLF